MVKIKIWGLISLETSNIVEEALSSLKDELEPVLIILNSQGGSLYDTLAIIAMLKAIPNPIITLCMGVCLSRCI